MRLVQIKLKNFRSFYGTQTIDFSTSEKKPITVIYAGTGVGKTTIINAITWCLYGDELHKLKGAQIGILNDLAKTGMKYGDVIDVQVELFLGEEGDHISCVFNRTLSFTKSKDGTVRPLPPIDGNFKAKIEDLRKNLIEAGDPNVVVRRVFPKEVNHLFIFDGEQLDKFFMEESYENVKNAILDITQIDFLESSIKHLRDVSRFYRKESSSDSDPVIENLQNGIKSYEKRISEFQTNLDENRINLDSARTKLNEINEGLKGINAADAKELISKKELKMIDLKNQEGFLINLEQESFDHLLKIVPSIFCKSKIENAIKLIDKEYESGSIPPDIKIEFIDKLLNKKRSCICGTPLKEGSNAWKNVMKFRDIAPISEYEPEIRKCQSELKLILKDISRFHEERKDYFN